MSEISPIMFLVNIQKMKKHLMNDKTIIDMFKEYDVDIEELKLIPMSFSDLDVSAKCDHGVIYFNKKLLRIFIL